MFKCLTAAVLLLYHAQCSIVYDSIGQKGIYLSEYCPKFGSCDVGTHVMCMYYDPHRPMGARCSKPKNITITPELAEEILAFVNQGRSRIANGTERGGQDNDFPYPRGYGMFRLRWDKELATFAQILANQCILRHDICRATKKFKNPGQAMGLVRFSYPDWMPVSHQPGMDKAGLTVSKLKFAIEMAYQSWYAQKKHVTAQELLSPPDYNQPGQRGKLYLSLINGRSTFMGCGVSAYSDYAYYDNDASLTYNVVQLVCNFSENVYQGVPVYEVKPPTEVGYTVTCGCPPGWDEDDQCLCVPGVRKAIKNDGDCSGTDHSCKPTVVLLPIFTVENAPPEKTALRMDNERKDSEPEIMDLYIPPDNNSILHPMSIGPQSSMLSNIINDDPHTSMIRPYTGTIRKDYLDHKLPIIQEPMHAKDPTNVLHSLLNEVHHEISYPTTTSIKSQIYTVQNRFFDKQNLFNNGYKSPTITPKSPSYSRPPVKKESVFTKVATFELPKKNEHVLKHDVTPRKDFTKAKSLAKDYMDSRRHLIIAKKEKPKTAVGFLKSLTEHVTTKVPHLNSAEEKVISFNYYLKKADSKNVKPNKNNILSDNELEDSSKEKPNDKLMTLLDKLEQEVKHIELDKNKKEVLDAKIRKIYGTLVGKTELSTYKPNLVELPDSELVSDHEKYEPNRIKYSDMDNHLLAKQTRKHIFNGHKSDKKHIHEKMVENVHPDDSQNEVRPVSTNLNDLIDRYNEIKSNKNRDLKIGKDYDSDNENRKSKYSRIVFSNRDEPSDVDPYSDKEAIRNRIIFSEAEEKKRIKDSAKKNRQPISDHEEDPLSLERRKYYQEKLDKMERKLYSTRKYKHHSEAQLPSSNPIMRPIIQSPSRNEEPTHEHTKSQADPFYMPDRARFLHGF